MYCAWNYNPSLGEAKMVKMEDHTRILPAWTSRAQMTKVYGRSFLIFARKWV